MITFLGQGIFFHDEGYILTNKHVIQKNNAPLFVNYQGQDYSVKNVWRDEKQDLAIIKIDHSIQNFSPPIFQEHIQDQENFPVWAITLEKIQS